MVAVKYGKELPRRLGWVNMANSSASNSASGSAGSHQDRALAEMINGLKEESINRGATALMDEDVGSFGVPNPRILIVGCGGSGNNTLQNYPPWCRRRSHCCNQYR